jgi:hypothetical protein
MSRESEDLTKKVVDAVEEVEEEERKDSNVITLSSGVKIKIKAVNKHFIYQATSRFKPPKAPRVKNETKGREEENPNDPDYLQELEMYLAEVSMVANDVALLRGAEVVEIPKEIDDPDSKAWKEEMEVLGLATDSKKYRYLSWLKAVAIPNDEEMNMVLQEIGRLTGVAEADVAEAVERFRSLARGEEDRQGTNVD